MMQPRFSGILLAFREIKSIYHFKKEIIRHQQRSLFFHLDKETRHVSEQAFSKMSNILFSLHF